MRGKGAAAAALFTSLLIDMACLPIHAGQFHNYTQLTSSQVAFVSKMLGYEDAKNHCAKNNSTLVEIWNEAEWKEVSPEIRRYSK